MPLDPDGKPRGTPVTVDAPAYPAGLGLAWNGLGFVIAEAGNDPGSTCWSRRFLLLDEVGDSAGASWLELPDSDRGTAAGRTSVAFSGASYIAVWEEHGECGGSGEERVRYAVLSADGERSAGGIGLGPAGCGAAPDVVWTGQAYGITWCSVDDSWVVRQYLAFLDRDGRMVAAPRIAWTSDAPRGARGAPLGVLDLDFGHGTYALAWSAGGAVHLARWDRVGSFVELAVILPATGAVDPLAVGLGVDPTGFGVLTADPRGDGSMDPVFVHRNVEL